MPMLDFSKDRYYGKIYSRAQTVLFAGLLFAGASAAALPLFVRNSAALAFVYFSCILVAACGYKWGARIALLAGMFLGVGDLIILRLHVESNASLQLSVLSSIVAFIALALGFGSAGKVARDLHQIKFSDQTPRAADREILLALLEKELARAKRHRQPSSLAIVEFRTLDKVESEYGRHQMDLLLRQLQLVLVRQLRRSDTLAWLGGPYFALLLPGTDPKGAEAAIDRLRESARNTPPRSFFHLGMDVSDLSTAVIEIKGDDLDPYATLNRVASKLGPLVQRRVGLCLQGREAAI